MLSQRTFARGRPAPGVGLVDHVVVVQRGQVHQLDRDRARRSAADRWGRRSSRPAAPASRGTACRRPRSGTTTSRRAARRTRRRTDFSSACSTWSRRARISASRAASGASSPGITRRLIAYLTDLEDSPRARPRRIPTINPGNDAERQRERRPGSRARAGASGSDRPVVAPLRLLHVHQDDHPEVEERRRPRSDSTPISASGQCAGPDRRAEHPHLRDEARPWAGCPRATAGRSSSAPPAAGCRLRQARVGRRARSAPRPRAETSITTPNAPSVIGAYATR